MIIKALTPLVKFQMPINSSQKIRIGTRTSKLALIQADEIKNALLAKTALQENQIEIIQITTSGDKIQDMSLAEIGGKGLFIKELEENLLEKKIDIAIHCAKDMPPILHKSTRIVAFGVRKDARDYFISQQFQTLQDLPQGAVVGTSSARRKAALLRLRPDLKITNFRGNVDTRLKKIEENQVDATILALCGLQRLGKKIDEKNIITTEDILPAAGQGALALQILDENKTIYDLARKINDEKTEICVNIEREFLRLLNASCKSPIAAYCNFIDAKNLRLQTMIFNFDGSEIFATDFKVKLEDVQDLARKSADETKNKAQKLLAMICS